MARPRIAVLVSGGGSNMQALLDAMDRGAVPGEVSYVLSSNKDAYALTRARSRRIPCEVIARRDYPDWEATHAARHAALIAAKVDFIVLAGYLGILPAQTVRAFAGRILNVHPSLIPAFCGPGMYGQRVHQAVLDAGVKLTGATVHFVEEGVDTGPIILQAAVPVLPGDDAPSLAARVLKMEHKLLPLAVKYLVEGRLQVKGRQVSIQKSEGEGICGH